MMDPPMANIFELENGTLSTVRWYKTMTSILIGDD